MPADDQSELQPAEGKGGRRPNYHGDGSATEARLRRMVAEAKLRAVEEGALDEALDTLLDIVTGKREDGAFKASSPERRKAAASLAKILADQPGVQVNATRNELHLHPAEAVARLMADEHGLDDVQQLVRRLSRDAGRPGLGDDQDLPPALDAGAAPPAREPQDRARRNGKVPPPDPDGPAEAREE